MSNMQSSKEGNKVVITTILINLLLAFVKIIIGIVGKSAAMISDGVHSGSDVVSSGCVLIGLKMSQKPEDKEHQYGHEKYEQILTKILAMILLITGLTIGYEAVKVIINGEYVEPGRIAIYGAILSIIVKEWMYHYTLRVAKKIDSTALKADAWHHRTDALSSIAVLIGVVGARNGYLILEPLMAIVICIIIVKMSIGIFLEAASQLVDTAVDDETLKELEAIIYSVEDVLSIDELKTRIHSNRIYIDLEIGLDENLTFVEAHEIAEEIHEKVEKEMPKVKHCSIHFHPK